MRWLNVLQEAVYCFASFTTMFTVIVTVCSLKSMCIPSFGSCVSELHAPVVMYCLRLFIVVLQ